MPSSTLTYELTPPRRPGINDVGGGELEDHPKAPPNPKTHPTAGGLNQTAKLLVALDKVTPVISVSVGITGGNPSVLLVTHKRESTVAVTVVDNGVGDTTVQWAKGTFPTPIRRPGADVNGATPAMFSVEPFSDVDHDGVRMRTADAAGAAVDVDFSVDSF